MATKNEFIGPGNPVAFGAPANQGWAPPGFENAYAQAKLDVATQPLAASPVVAVPPAGATTPVVPVSPVVTPTTPATPTSASDSSAASATSVDLVTELKNAQIKADADTAAENARQIAAKTAEIEADYAKKERALGASQTEESKSSTALQFKLGREQTDYASEEARKLKDIQNQRITDLHNEQRDLLSRSVAAIESGNYQKARELKADAEKVSNLRLNVMQEQRAQVASDLQAALGASTLATQKFELASKNAAIFSMGILNTDDTGNTTLMDDESIQAYADEHKMDPDMLKANAIKQANDLNKLNREDRKAEIDYAIAQRTLLEKGLDVAKKQQGLDAAKQLQDFSGMDQLKIKDLSTSIFGKVRGSNPVNLGIIAGLFGEGKDINTIKNELQYSNQSDKFTGAFQDAAGAIISNTDPKKAEMIKNELDRRLENNDTGGALDYLKKVAVDNSSLGVEGSKVLRGKERTVQFIGEIKADLDKLTAGGVNTNIFSGTEEQIAKNLGMVKNEELRKVATKASLALQKYRKDMTGVAFGEGENKEYKAIFPDIKNTQNLNNATIEALQGAFNGDIEDFYKKEMGSSAYDKLFKLPQQQKQEFEDFYGKAPDTTKATMEQIFNDPKYKTIEEGQQAALEWANQTSGKTNVGSDTNPATFKEVTQAPVGSKGGECGRFVNKITGLGVGDSYQSKMAKMDLSIKEPEAGMVFTMPYKDTGHTGFILSVKDGIATVKDSNYHSVVGSANYDPEKIAIHQIPVSKMTGFKRV
jgi:hypothetical protein